MWKGKPGHQASIWLPCQALAMPIFTQAMWVTLRAWLCHIPSLVIFVLNGGLGLGTIHFNFDLGVGLFTCWEAGTLGPALTAPTPSRVASFPHPVLWKSFLRMPSELYHPNSAVSCLIFIGG